MFACTSRSERSVPCCRATMFSARAAFHFERECCDNIGCPQCPSELIDIRRQQMIDTLRAALPHRTASEVATLALEALAFEPWSLAHPWTREQAIKRARAREVLRTFLVVNAAPDGAPQHESVAEVGADLNEQAGHEHSA